MASQVIAYYSLGWRDFYALPIYTFWELAKNVDRIKAEDDIRLMCAIGNAFGGSGDYAERLEDAKGVVIEVEEDVSHAVNILRNLIGG